MTGTDLARNVAIDASLVDEINRRHREVEQHARATLESAIECGRLLTAAKESLPHGEWLPWLSENFDGSERTAQTYMRLHEHGDDILAARDGNPQRVADLSLRAALRDIATPRERTRDDTHLHRVLPGLTAQATDPGPAAPPPDEPATARTPPAQPQDADEAITVDAQVMLDPPDALDAEQQRQWERADDAFHDLRELMTEATGRGLAPLSVAHALRDASLKARMLAGVLENLSGGIETRERRRAA